MNRVITYPPIPLVLIPKSNHKVADDHNNHVDNHGWQTHFRLSNTLVLASGPHGDPVRKKTVRSQPNETANQNRKIEEANRLTIEVVRWLRKSLALGEVQRQEATGRPGDDESRQLDNGETQQLPRDPEADQRRLDVVPVQLPQLELLLRRPALVQVRISLCGILNVHTLLLRNFDGLLRLRVIDSRRRTLLPFTSDLVGMNTVPFRLGEEEDLEQQQETQNPDVQPEEAPPADRLRHGACNDGADHERAEVKGKV